MLSCTCAVTAVVPMIKRRVVAAKQTGTARFVAILIVTDPFRNGPSWATTAPHERGAGVCLAVTLYHTNDCNVKVDDADRKLYWPHPVPYMEWMLGIAQI